MKKNRLVKGLAAGAGFFFLSGTPALTRAQSLPPVPAQALPKVSPQVRAKKAPGPMDDFAGLNYTDEQKAKINQIHQDMKARMDAVLKDDKLGPEQKGAMIQGYQHMERGEVYKVLTREQQIEVRKRILARRTEARQEQERNKQAVPTPHSSPQQPPQPSKPPQAPPA